MLGSPNFKLQFSLSYIQWNSRGSLDKNHRGWLKVVLVLISEGFWCRRPFSKFISSKNDVQLNLSTCVHRFHVFVCKQKVSAWGLGTWITTKISFKNAQKLMPWQMTAPCGRRFPAGRPNLTCFPVEALECSPSGWCWTRTRQSQISTVLSTVGH